MDQFLEGNILAFPWSITTHYLEMVFLLGKLKFLMYAFKWGTHFYMRVGLFVFKRRRLNYTIIFQTQYLHIMIVVLSWSSHKCCTPGCGSVVVFDGNMKAQHRICSALKSGVKNFPASDSSITIGEF